MFRLCPFLLAASASAQIYAPAQTCETRVHPEQTVEYRHPLTGRTRAVRLVVEEPLGTGGAELRGLPLVVWLHGGAGGGTPRNLAGWRRTTARGCYLSATIGHPWPDAAQARALCAWMGREYGGDCGAAREGQVKLLNVERPHDLAAVLDSLLADWSGRVDPERIAVAGHSAGGGATLMAAGAARGYHSRVERFADPRPRAFLAFSPQGPGKDGFFDSIPGDGSTSFDQVRRPTLIVTGAGDSTCKSRFECDAGEPPSNRRAVFDLLPARPAGAPDKFLLFVTDASAPHGRFGFGRARCASERGPVPDADCDRILDLLASTALAFLDANVRGRAEARTWLRSGAAERAGPAVWRAK